MSLEPLTAELSGLIAKLDPAGRRTLARAVAGMLRASNQKRIAAQQNPDGSAFAPRKNQARAKKGAIKRGAMFKKLRTARFMRMSATANEAVVSITGRAGRIAAAHQFGLRDRVRPGGAEVKYPVRELVGFSGDDVSAIADLVINHL